MPDMNYCRASWEKCLPDIHCIHVHYISIYILLAMTTCDFCKKPVEIKEITSYASNGSTFSVNVVCFDSCLTMDITFTKLKEKTQDSSFCNYNLSATTDRLFLPVTVDLVFSVASARGR